MRIALFSCQNYDIEPIKQGALKHCPNYELIFHKSQLNSNTVDLSKDCNAVVIFVNDIADQQVLSKLHEMGIKLVALRATGVDNVDLNVAKNLGIHVINVPGYSPYAIAEHAISLIMCLNRHVHRAYSRTKDFNFMLNGLLGFDMHGKTVGVIGTGNIGTTFAKICLGFGCNVLAYDIKQNQEVVDAGVKYVTKEELYQSSDIISLHCPLLSSTYHLINKEAIAQMKDGVILANTSRGGLVDAKAVLSGIKTKKLGGVALDVYEGEKGLFNRDLSGSIVMDDTLVRLINFPNVIVTAHQAYFTKEALNMIADTMIRGVSTYLEKNEVMNPVA